MTVVSVLPAPDTHTPTNYRYIHIKLTEHFLNESTEIFKPDFSFWIGYGIIENMLPVYTTFMFATLRSPEVEALKRTETFDLVAFGWYYNDFQLGLAAHFNCPAIILSTTPSTYVGVRKLVGNPAAVSTVAYDLDILTGSEGMSFSQRIWNVNQLIFDKIFNWWIQKWVYEPYYQNIFPSHQYPSLAEIQGNVSLILVSSHFTEAQPVPLVPAVIEVGGMHISRIVREPPANIKAFMDNAGDHGVIVFSFDEGLMSSEIAPYIVEIFIKVFGTMQQRVLWKWEHSKDLPKRLPDNVMVVDWIPQTDVLAHHNVKGLITNWGKIGVTEAMWYGVPILAINFKTGKSNSGYSTIRGGWGLKVNYQYLEEDSLTRAIYKVIKSARIRQAARALSTRYRDRPMHPLETGMFWAEYVLRHKGAPHMQSPGVHMNMIKYYLMDVFFLYAHMLCVILVFVLALIFGICFAIYWISLWCCKKIKNSFIARFYASPLKQKYKKSRKSRRQLDKDQKPAMKH